MYNKQCPEYIAEATSDNITRAINIVFTCIIHIKPYIVLEIFRKSGTIIPKIKNLWLFYNEEAPAQ